MENGRATSPHIELRDDRPSPTREEEEGQTSPGMRNSKGWDGKLRVERSAVLANPEILSDPESDDENVLPGETVPADEGKKDVGARFDRDYAS